MISNKVGDQLIMKGMMMMVMMITMMKIMEEMIMVPLKTVIILMLIRMLVINEYDPNYDCIPLPPTKKDILYKTLAKNLSYSPPPPLTVLFRYCEYTIHAYIYVYCNMHV